jgi:hypothetical protein
MKTKHGLENYPARAVFKLLKDYGPLTVSSPADFH